MTIFEFLVAFAAILAGLGATRLLHAFPYVFNKDKSFWLHQLIFLYTIINAIGAWWATWSMSKVERWDLLKFASYILYFGVFFLLCDLIAPNNSEKIDSWKDHFFKIRKSFYICNIFLAQFFYLNQTYVLEIDNYEFFVIYLVWTVTSILGTISDNYKTQSILVVFTFLYVLILNISKFIMESPMFH